MRARHKIRRRTVLEIRLDMLQVMKNGAEKPTHIMNLSNLSWKPTMEHCNALEEMNLIKSKDSETDDMRSHIIYVLTQKGNNLLQKMLALEINKIGGKSLILEGDSKIFGGEVR